MELEECRKPIESLYDYISNGGTISDAGEESDQIDNPNAYLQTVLIPECITSFYKAINLSVLKGEYLLSLEDIESKIKELKKLASDVHKLGFDLSESGEQQVLIDNIIRLMEISLSQYLTFVTELKHNLSHKQPALIRNIASKEGLKLLIEGSDIIRDSFELFRMNLVIAKYDHTLIASEGILGDLLSVRNNLDQPRFRPLNYSLIILDKCRFLIKKIIYRIEDTLKGILYSFRFQNQDFHYSSPQLELQFLNNLEEKLRSHYSPSLNVVEGLVRADLSNELSSYHALIQVYKDNYRNNEQIKELIKKFEKIYHGEKFIENQTLFNQRAFHIAFNYLINNEFSFIAFQAGTASILNTKHGDEQFDRIFQELMSFLEKIEATQYRTGVINYFPFLRMSRMISDRIMRLTQREDVDYEELVVPLVFNLEKYLSKTTDKLKQCKEQNFTAYQLSYNECKIEIPLYTDHSLEFIFLASSYILPLDYVQIEQEIESLQRNLYKYQTIVDVQQSINHEKKAIQNIKKEFNELNKKSIEIISIFAAIVVFSAGSIKIFEIKGITFQDGLKFMLCFSYCLILFVFLIWLITRENIKTISKLHWTFFSMLAVIAMLSLLYVVGWISSVFSGFIVAAILIIGLILLKTIILTKIKY